MEITDDMMENLKDCKNPNFPIIIFLVLTYLEKKNIINIT